MVVVDLLGVPPSGELSFQHRVGWPDGELLRNQPGANGNPVVVAVYRQSPAAEGAEGQHRSTGFGANAGQGFQPLSSLWDWNLGQEAQVEAPSLHCNLLEHLLDAGCFLLWPGAGRYGLLNGWRVPISYRFPGGELGAELLEGPARIFVLRTVGEQG